MKQNKIIITTALLFILVIVAFMAWDFFSKNTDKKNVYEYNLDSYKEVDKNLISHNEAYQIKPTFNKIKGVNTNLKDDIYVTGNGFVEIYNKSGDVINKIKTNVNARCLSVDENDNIILGVGNHIEIWSNNGILKQKWESINNCIITSIAIVDSAIFIADAGNKVVYHFNKKGKLLNTIGEKDMDQGIQGFVIPSPYFDIAIGRDSELWAVNSGRHQLEAYTPDGKLISSWKKSSMQLNGFSGCCNPSHIAILKDGSFVTSEKGIVRVKIHNPEGTFKSVVASPEMFEDGTTGLDIAVDSEGRIIVLDPKMGLIRIFEKS